MVLLPVLIAGATVVSAQEGGDDKVTVDNECSSGGWFEKKTCEMMNSGVGWVLTMIANFIGGIIAWVIDMIVGTPVPTHNGGDPAIIQRPDNQPWQTVYDSWLSIAVPIGLAEWGLMVLGVLFSQVYISGSDAELKRRELQHRTWKVLLGVLGSWAIGATILHIANATTHAIAPTADDVAGNLAVFAANGQSVVIAAILMWLLGATIFLFILLLLLARVAVVFTMMWGLPVLIPLAAIDVGPVAPLSKPARNIIDMFIPFAFLTLPMALVLKVGYLVVTGLNQSPLVAGGLHFFGVNGMILLGFWIVAALSPLFVFHQAGRIAGYAVLMGSSSISADLRNKVQDAKENVNSRTPPRYDRGPETHDVFEGAPTKDRFGGKLDGAVRETDRQTMLEAAQEREALEATNSRHALGAANNGSPLGAANNGSELGTAHNGAPLGNGEYGPKAPEGASPLGKGNVRTTGASGASTTGATASGPMITRDNVVQVDHPRDLPSGPGYQIGMVEDGEFQPVAAHDGLGREPILNGMYNRLNSGVGRFSDERLLLRSNDDGAFYDLDSMTYREQSYEEMSRNTSDDVLNS